jgi:integrase
MTKNGKAHDVPLNGFAAKVLRLWRNQSPGKFKKDSLVFAGPNGKQIHDLRRAWKSVLKAAKIEEFRFHDLRHTFASNLVMSGVSLFAVQKLLNHSSPAMTERYAKLAPKWMEQTVSKLSEDAKWTL